MLAQGHNQLMQGRVRGGLDMSAQVARVTKAASKGPTVRPRVNLQGRDGDRQATINANEGNNDDNNDSLQDT